MRAIRTILGLFIAMATLGAVASAVSAAFLRQRIASTGSEADDEFDLAAIFTGLEFRSRAAALRRASILAWYGGGTLDLRGANLDAGGATLGVRAIFGGLRLVIPAGWRVETNVLSILGGVGDTRDAEEVAADGPVLRISGWAAFGGIGIVADAPDLDAPIAAGPQATAANAAPLETAPVDMPIEAAPAASPA